MEIQTITVLQANPAHPEIQFVTNHAGDIEVYRSNPHGVAVQSDRLATIRRDQAPKLADFFIAHT